MTITKSDSERAFNTFQNESGSIREKLEAVLAQYTNKPVSRQQVLDATEAIKGWLPGWTRHDQRQLVVIIFKAAGFDVEGWFG